MEIIDRYVHEVGRHLPWKLRADVEAELRSLLEETVEERARAAQRPADPELAAQVVREFGAPQEVAMRYVPQDQYLIGPRLFPAFKLTLKIMLIVLAAVSGVALLLAILAPLTGHTEHLNLRQLGESLVKFIATAFFNLALVTLVFAVVERVQARREAKAPAWNPGMLPPVNDPDRISPVGLVIGMYTILAFAVLFNFYPEWVGVSILDHGVVRLERWLKPEFAMYMPFINLWWGLDFALKLTVLRHGQWRRETRWAEFGLGLFGTLILYLIVVGGPVFKFDYLVKAFLKGIIVIVMIESGVRLYRLLTRRPFDSWHAPEPSATRNRAG